jgi:hypothetical protein
MWPEDSTLQERAEDIYKSQIGRTGTQFTDQRQAILLLPGKYPEDFDINIGYYTSVAGVGRTPHDVVIRSVGAFNEENGHATENFWRSFEGVELTGDQITWAVSQGAAARRTVIRGDLHLSQDAGWSSGGFLADSNVLGQVITGTQQQWFFRNADMPGGIQCSAGWNYVFVGAAGMSQEAYDACGAREPGMATVVEKTPRVAGKPYLVFDDETWYIYVPQYLENAVGVNHRLVADSARKILVDTEVFVAKPEHSAQDINQGIKGKKALLITPGVYTLWDRIKILEDGFVVLGIGFPTLITVTGRSAIQVADGTTDVRMASVLLEAGTPRSHGETEPLLLWGSKVEEGDQDDYLFPRREGPSGVLSDIFARVGAFNHTNCAKVRADAMVQIDSDDVVVDNIWLWHADHDDCGTSLNSYGPSDECHTGHGFLVNGDRVTTYGLAVEHVNGGDMVLWNGEGGETYFYQAELPYHNAYFGEANFVGFRVARGVQQHTMWGIGVYIIGDVASVRSAIRVPATSQVTNLITIVIEGVATQFRNILCLEDASEESEDYCVAPESCGAGNRCVYRWLSPLKSASNDDSIEPLEAIMVKHERQSNAVPTRREQDAAAKALAYLGRSSRVAGCALLSASALLLAVGQLRGRLMRPARGCQPVMPMDAPLQSEE